MNHMASYTSKIVHWSKSYIEYLSSIEVTFIISFYLHLMKGISLTLVGGRHFSKGQLFHPRFLELKTNFMFLFFACLCVT